MEWTLRASSPRLAFPRTMCARSPITSATRRSAASPATGSRASPGSRRCPTSIRPRDPERLVAEEGYERWHGRGALGYLTLAAICDAQLGSPPKHARLIAAQKTFPTGMLGYWVRRLAEGGLVAALTTTSPPRLAHPDGGPKLAGTNPLAIGIPSSDGSPVVADVSMAAVTHGEVIAGLAKPEDVVPFGGDQAHKAFALAVGLQLLVDSLIGEGYGAVMLVAQPGGRSRACPTRARRGRTLAR